ncbi:MAG: hypothetical protein PHV06_10690 [bacterium]|nr:hypothetical protein [bacterium]
MSCREKNLSEPVIISVVFTSDINGNIYPCGCRVPLGGISERGYEIKSLISRDKDILILDNGSALWGINHIVERSKGKVIIEAMNEMEYDAMNLRATDLAFYTIQQIKELQAEAKFEFISANLKIKNDEVKLKPYLIFEVKGLKIGITGVSEFNKNSQEKYDYVKPEYALTELIPKLREKTDFIILLSGLEPRESANLARMVSGLDLIIAAPSTLPNIKPTILNESIIATTFKDGKSIGFMQLGFSIERKLTDHKHEHRQIQEGMVKDKKIQNILKKYQIGE